MRILFFTPYIDRTGSEIFLLNLCKVLKEKEAEIAVISKYKGDLYSEFGKYANVHSLEIGKRNFFSKNYRRIKGKIDLLTGNNHSAIRKLHKSIKPDLWYVNTMAFPEIYNLAEKLKVKVITHFHELPFQYTTISENELEKMIRRSSCLVACSEAVAEVLRDMGGKNILLQYEAIDAKRIVISKTKEEIKRELGITAQEKVVLMSGLRTYRKGMDLFIDVAEKLKDEKIKFIWVGKELGDGFHYYVKQKTIHRKLNNVIWIEEKKNDYFNYLQTADIFFLSSREDPFPLSMIEAGLMGKPIIAFNSGGAREFIQPNNGICISGHNTDLLAENIMEMMKIEFDQEKIRIHAMKYTIEQQLNDFYLNLIALIGKDR